MLQYNAGLLLREADPAARVLTFVFYHCVGMGGIREQNYGFPSKGKLGVLPTYTAMQDSWEHKDVPAVDTVYQVGENQTTIIFPDKSRSVKSRRIVDLHDYMVVRDTFKLKSITKVILS